MRCSSICFSSLFVVSKSTQVALINIKIKRNYLESNYLFQHDHLDKGIEQLLLDCGATASTCTLKKATFQQNYQAIFVKNEMLALGLQV